MAVLSGQNVRLCPTRLVCRGQRFLDPNAAARSRAQLDEEVTNQSPSLSAKPRKV